MGSEIIKGGFDLLKLVYGDGVSPFVKEIGQTLADVISFLTTPIHCASERYKENMKKHIELIGAKVKDIPEDRRVQVIPDIGVPILERLQCTTNEELADLFTTLLASASSKDTEEFAHPSFINVISRISSDEARIIKYLKSLEYKEIPYLKYKLLYSSNTFDYLQEYTTLIKKQVELSYEDNECLYFENLINLGVLKDGFDLQQSSDIEYIRIDNYYGEKYKKKYLHAPYKNLEYVKSFLYVTSYGKMFMDACVR